MPGTKTHSVNAGYMSHVRDDPERLIERAAAHLEGVSYNTLVGTGLSGALIVPVLARALDKRWLIIRKRGDRSHSATPSEGVLGTRWVFVDDFISSGATLCRVKQGVYETQRYGRRRNPFPTRFVGAYLYQDYNYTGIADNHGEFRPASELTDYRRSATV